MEEVRYLIWNNGNTCRITCNDTRSEFRDIADGSVICDIGCILSEIADIAEKCKKMGVKAIFENMGRRKKESVWKVMDDGWFEYYYCKHCGHKQQLTIDKAPLPKICPECDRSE